MKLRFPAEIDAHLSFAALDNAEVTVTTEGESIDGVLGYSDTFGTVTFFARNGARLRPDAEIRASYRLDNQIMQFVTRVIDIVGNRWQLRRPHNIDVTYTDSDDVQH